jgi:hypothetical protein
VGKPKLNRPGRLHGANLSRASLADALAPAASLNNIRYVSPKFLGALIHVSDRFDASHQQTSVSLYLMHMRLFFQISNAFSIARGIGPGTLPSSG